MWKITHFTLIIVYPEITVSHSEWDAKTAVLRLKNIIYTYLYNFIYLFIFIILYVLFKVRKRT